MLAFLLFTSCSTASKSEMPLAPPAREEQNYLYNGRLFYEMNTAVGLQNKPQSKLWHFRGEWYGILPGDDAQGDTGTHLVHIGNKGETVDILQEIFPFTGIADVFPREEFVYIVFDSHEKA